MLGLLFIICLLGGALALDTIKDFFPIALLPFFLTKVKSTKVCMY